MKNKILKLNASTLEFEEIEVKEQQVYYEEIMSAVGEYYEAVPSIYVNKILNNLSIVAYCDESGMLKNLKQSILVMDKKSKRPLIILCGDIVFTKLKNENDYTLNDFEINTIKRVFQEVKEVIVCESEKFKVRVERI